MASVVSIAALDDTLHSIKLHVRVVRVWQGRGNNAIVNFVLLDNQGGAIQGTAKAQDYRRFRVHLAEGRLCEVTRFTVAPAGTIFVAVKHGFQLSLSRESTVYPLSTPSLNIPFTYFELTELEEVGVSLTSPTDIMDVVARIVGFSPVQNVQVSSGLARVATLFIANERDFVMDVALWEDFIDKFDIPAIMAQSATSPVVVACNSLQLRKYHVRCCLKTFVGTKFHFDENIPEIVAFRSRLSPNQPPVFSDAASAAQCMGRFAVMPAPRVQRRPMTLLQLSEVRGASDTDIFQCVAEITHIVTRHDWYYLSCPHCFHKLQDPDDRPICNNNKCGYYRSRVIPVPWYRFTVRVNDETATTCFVLLGRQAEMVVGPRASAVASQPNPNPDDCPPALLEIIGKRFLFAVSTRDAAAYPKFNSYTVQQVEHVPADHPLMLLPPPANPALHQQLTGYQASPSLMAHIPVQQPQLAIDLPAPEQQTPPADPVVHQQFAGHQPDSSLVATTVVQQPQLAVDLPLPLQQAAPQSPLPIKRMDPAASVSHLVNIRDVRRRLDFSSQKESDHASDVADTASSLSKEEPT